MGDWALPTLSSLYPDFLAQLKARDLDAITLGFFLVPAPIVGMIRYDRPGNYFQEYIAGNTWQTKVLSVAGGGTGSSTPGGAGVALGLGGMAYQQPNNVSISGGVITGLSQLQNNGTFSNSGRVDFYGGLWVNAGGVALNGTLQCNNNAVIAGQLDCNFISAPAGAQFLPSGNVAVGGNLTISGTSNLNGVVNIAQAHVTGPGGLTVDYDAAIGRTLYANNAVLNTTLTVPNLTVSGTVTTGDLVATNNLSVSGPSAFFAGNLNIEGHITKVGNITSFGALFAGGASLSGNLTANGQIYAGSTNQVLTHPNGKLYTGAMGFSGWTGSGTRVLLDNETWVDIKTVGGGGVVEIIHVVLNFPEGVSFIEYNIPWSFPPTHAGKYYAVFDSNGLMQETYQFEYYSPTQMRIRKLNPTLLTTNMSFTIIQHKTDVG